MNIIGTILAFLFCSVMSVVLTADIMYGAMLLFGLYFLEIVFIDLPALPSIVQIYPADIVFVVLFGSLAIRVMTGRFRFHRQRKVIYLWAALIAFSAMRGFLTFGLKSAGLDFRGQFYVFSCLAYFSSFQLAPETRKKLLGLFLKLSVAVTSVVFVRWIGVATGTMFNIGWATSTEDGHMMRVLNAGDTFMLSFAFFASLFLHINKRGELWQRKLFYVIGPTIILLQHRTVWLVILVGILLLGVQEKRFRRQSITALVGMVVIGLIVGALFFARGTNVAETLSNSATSDETFVWRLETWHQLLFNNPNATLLNDIIGQPYGSGYDRHMFNERDITDTTPHNYYVEMYLRVGIIGLMTVILLYVRSIKLWKRLPISLRPMAYPDARFWMLLLIGQMVFFSLYGAQYPQMVLVGISMAGLSMRPRRIPAPAPNAAPTQTQGPKAATA